MMSITHATIAVAGTSLILGTAEPLPLGLAVLGSQLPDLDTSTSTIGQIFFPISHWIEDRFPHRSVTHSLLATGAITVCSLLVGHFLLGDIFKLVALPLGHLLACFSDCFTLQGVQLFYPYPAWAVSVSNPRRRIKTGGASELWVLAGSIALLIVGIYFASGGGITQQVSQQLGLKDGLVEVYNKNAASHHVWAEIEGVKASDRSSVSGRYFILGTAGSEFIVTDGEGIYKTGEQIITSKMNTSVGQSASTQVKTLTFNDQEAIAPLTQLQASFPNAAIYLSGSITIDFPEEVKLPTLANQYESIAITGTTVKMDYEPIESAIALLKGQFAVGTLTAKIIQPSPEFK